MKKFIFPAAFAIALIASAFTTIPEASKWNLSDEYSVKFVSADPTGIFKKMTADITFDENNLAESNFKAAIDVASINTGNGSQNGHAKSAKWFDAEKHPHITFESSEISKTDEAFKVKGNLTIKGIQKEIEFPFTFTDNTFTASFMVKRLDYNLGEKGGGASEEIKIELSVPVTK